MIPETLLCEYYEKHPMDVPCKFRKHHFLIGKIKEHKWLGEHEHFLCEERKKRRGSHWIPIQYVPIHWIKKASSLRKEKPRKVIKLATKPVQRSLPSTAAKPLKIPQKKALKTPPSKLQGMYMVVSHEFRISLLITFLY